MAAIHEKALLLVDPKRARRLKDDAPDQAQADQAARVFKALSDPTRLRLAAALSMGDELCVCDLSEIVGAAQNLASHHLHALRNAGVATSRRDGKMVIYSLTDLGLNLVKAGVVTRTGR
jgi:DNA-binding transcriptional ArsR family regulator